MEQSMNYLRSNLLVNVSESDGGFDYVSTDTDAVVFDIKERAQAAITSFQVHLIKWTERR